MRLLLLLDDSITELRTVPLADWTAVLLGAALIALGFFLG